MAKYNKVECPNCGATLSSDSESCLKCGEYPDDFIKQNQSIDELEDDMIANKRHLSGPIDDHGRNGILDAIDIDDDDDWERWEDPFYDMIKLPIPNYYLIVVPMDAWNVGIFKGVLRWESKMADENQQPNYRHLSSVDYRLISSNIANITEEQAKGILPSFEEPKGWINYVDYVNGGKETKGDGKRSIVVGFSEALPALHSAFDSVGAVWRNKLGEKPKADIINDRQTLLPRNAGSIILWDEAQSLVKRFVLIEKEGRDE